jgi:hypothetical protein
MTRALLPVLLLACASAFAQQAVTPVKSDEMHPGYGTVERIVPVRLTARERSAAAGGSTAKSTLEGRPAYRVSVRMADGTLQQRDVDNLEVKVGQDVLLTNAGDVLPDNAPARGDTGSRGNVAPGRSRDGSGPADGAIKGGTILPGEQGGIPDDKAKGSAGAGGSAPKARRCDELSGSLREQCLEKERRGAGARP